MGLRERISNCRPGQAERSRSYRPHWQEPPKPFWGEMPYVRRRGTLLEIAGIRSFDREVLQPRPRKGQAEIGAHHMSAARAPRRALPCP